MRVAATGCQDAAFSTIFRQTPTDSVAEGCGSEGWEEAMSNDGETEYSDRLSGEPSAAHWAD